MAVDPARELAALRDTPGIAARITLRTVQRIRRAARYAICLPPEQWAIGNLNPVLQFLAHIQRVRISAARLGQEQHAANLEDVLQELQALLAEGTEHTQLLQTLLDAALAPIRQVSDYKITSRTKRAAKLTADASSAGCWAVVEAGSTAVFVASTCSALTASQEPPHVVVEAAPSTAGICCAVGAAAGVWLLSNNISKQIAEAREAAVDLQGEAARVQAAQASLVEDWMQLEGAVLVAFAEEVQGGLLALQGELLSGRVDNVHEHCMQLACSVNALQHTLALLTCRV